MPPPQPWSLFLTPPLTLHCMPVQTRKALVQVYGIDKQQFSTWFKNRRPKPRKEASSVRRDFTGIRGSPTATDGLLQHAPSLSDRADGSGERAVHGDAGSPDDDGGYDAAVQKQYADMQQQYVAAQAQAEGQYTNSPVSCTGSLTGGGNGNGAAAVSLYSSPVKADPAHGPASPATHIAAAGSVSHMCGSDGAALGGGCTPPMDGRRISGSHEIKRRTSVCSRLEPPSKLVCSLSRTLSRTLSAGDSDNAVRLTHRHSSNNGAAAAAAHIGAGYPLDETMRNGGGGGSRCYDAQLHPDPPMLQSSHQPVPASQQALYQSHTSVRTPAHTSAHTSAQRRASLAGASLGGFEEAFAGAPARCGPPPSPAPTPAACDPSHMPHAPPLSREPSGDPRSWDATPVPPLPDWLDFPAWPESPSGSDERPESSLLFLSQSAIAAVAAEAAAAAEEAAGLMPPLMPTARARSMHAAHHAAHHYHYQGSAGGFYPTSPASAGTPLYPVPPSFKPSSASNAVGGPPAIVTGAKVGPFESRMPHHMHARPPSASAASAPNLGMHPGPAFSYPHRMHPGAFPHPGHPGPWAAGPRRRALPSQVPPGFVPVGYHGYPHTDARSGVRVDMGGDTVMMEGGPRGGMHALRPPPVWAQGMRERPQPSHFSGYHTPHSQRMPPHHGYPYTSPAHGAGAHAAAQRWGSCDAPLATWGSDVSDASGSPSCAAAAVAAAHSSSPSMGGLPQAHSIARSVTQAVSEMAVAGLGQQQHQQYNCREGLTADRTGAGADLEGGRDQMGAAAGGQQNGRPGAGVGSDCRANGLGLEGASSVHTRMAAHTCVGDALHDAPDMCMPPAWSNSMQQQQQQQQAMRKGHAAVAATPGVDVWTLPDCPGSVTNAASALDVFDLNAFGFLDDLNME